VRLNHVTLEASDVEESVRFYARVGLVQIVADYPNYARFVAPDGDTTLSLHRAESPRRGSSASIHFEVDDVDRTVAELKRAGFQFACDPVHQPYLWREAVLLDPDGHSVFIYHAGENRLDPPWRLAPSTDKSNHSDMTPWEIRRATREDIASVLELWEAAGGPVTVSDTHEGLTLLLGKDREALLIASSDGEAIGSLIAAWDGWRGSFYKLVVSPALRRRGLATELLREGERLLGAHGAGRLTAIVVEDDPAAVSFWDASGYEQQSKRARFVRHLKD
jgi:ribosomal protein S18 acetylase RimI-like enzyme/catechol 2,3-dioxygenase-like lactoylglutathione lyase family enzyme